MGGDASEKRGKCAGFGRIGREPTGKAGALLARGFRTPSQDRCVDSCPAPYGRFSCVVLLDGMNRSSPGYGNGVVELDDEQGDLDPQQLKQSLLELFRSPNYAPPLLPAVAIELLTLTQKRNASIADVVNLLGTDPILAGEVLKVAQSALYSSGRPLHTLDDAVVRLGMQRVSEIFLRVSMENKVFRAPGYAHEMDMLRRHSAFTAEAARIVSQRTFGLNEHVFLCGLLHDVGIAACILALSGPLKDLAPHGFALAWPTVRDIHEACSELLVRTWGLPPEVSLVLRLHHDPVVDGRVHPLAAAVRLADCFADKLGAGFHSDGHPEHMEETAKILRLGPAEFASLEKAITELAARMVPAAPPASSARSQVQPAVSSRSQAQLPAVASRSRADLPAVASPHARSQANLPAVSARSRADLPMVAAPNSRSQADLPAVAPNPRRRP